MRCFEKVDAEGVVCVFCRVFVFLSGRISGTWQEIGGEDNGSIKGCCLL